MRIGMILDKTFPPDPRVENECTALIEKGHQVFLFCLKYKEELTSEKINGIDIRRYASSKLEFKLSALVFTIPFYSNIMAKRILKFLLENSIEAVHIHDMVIADAVLKANKNLKLPLVLDLHENRPEIMKLYPHLAKFPGKQLISTKKWKKKEEEFIRRVNKTVVVTQEAKSEIENRIELDKDKIIIVPNSVKKTFYSDVILNEHIINRYKGKYVLLYLGDTGIRRGLLTAIEAVKELKLSIPNLKLVIVGSNTSDTILQNTVKDYRLEEYVDFEGWKDIDLFPSYILASALGISPLYRNIHHDTTYANKLFQYMSFSRPVLVSDATAQEELIIKTKSGLVHKEKDVEDFTNKVLDLYNNPEQSKELGENGKSFIENEFCWEKVSQNLVDLYDGLSA